MSRKHVLLHLGAPKTATTSLQFCLLRNRSALAQEGIVYPAFTHGRETSQSAGLVPPGFHEKIGVDPRICESHISLFWLHQTRFPPSFEHQDALPEYDRDWTRELATFRDGPARHLVLSFEDVLFNYVYDLPRLRDRLHDLSVTIMIVLRPPGAVMSSLFGTHVTNEPRLTTGAGHHPAMPHYLSQGYAGLIARLEQQLAPDRIVLADMRRLFAPPRGLMGNFLDLAGLESGCDDSLHANTSLPADAILMVRRFNRRKLDKTAWKDLVWKLHAHFEADPPPRDSTSFLPPALQQRLVERYEADRHALAARHGVTLSPSGPILPLQTDPTPGSEARILARIWPMLAPETQGALRACLPAICPR